MKQKRSTKKFLAPGPRSQPTGGLGDLLWFSWGVFSILLLITFIGWVLPPAVVSYDGNGSGTGTIVEKLVEGDYLYLRFSNGRDFRIDNRYDSYFQENGTSYFLVVVHKEGYDEVFSYGEL